MTITKRVRRAGAALALLACAAAAGCGSDRGATEGSQAVKAAFQQIRAGIGKEKGQAPAPDPEALALSAQKTVKGSILIAQIESRGMLTALGEIGTNAGLRTYATPGEQTMVLKGGVLVATRGLGADLMSSRADDAIRLIRSRSGGTVTRTWRYLDGEGIERPLPMTCTIATGAPQDIAFAGRRHATLQVGESCVSGPLKVDNAYWVTADGTIALSRQWIGPGLGHVTLQLVRP